MLQMVNDTIQEMGLTQALAAGTYTNSGTGAGCFLGQNTSRVDYGHYWPYQTYWMNYPVYVCTDKTKKAIEVLKALQAEKMLTCNSVPKFIDLVEKISNIL